MDQDVSRNRMDVDETSSKEAQDRQLRRYLSVADRDDSSPERDDIAESSGSGETRVQNRPVAQYDVQQYKAVQNMRREASCPRIIGQPGAKVNLMKTDMLGDDPRLAECEISINYREKLVITTTFDRSTLECTRCTRKHNALVSSGYRGERRPTVILVTDQDHPPYVETEACIPSIRVEDGSLSELLRILNRITHDIRLPSGTVVYLSSLSHLEKVGAAGYAADMVDTLNKIESDYNGHVRPLVGMPALEHTVSNPALIRHIHDTLSWMKEVDKKARYHLEVSTANYLEHVIYEKNETESELCESELPLQLPPSMRSYEKINMISSCGKRLLRDNLPEGGVDLDKILREITMKHALELVVRNSAEKRGGEEANAAGPSNSGGGGRGDATEASNTKITLVLVGSSHASRVADFLTGKNVDVRDLTSRGWSLTHESALEMADDLKSAISDCNSETTVVLLQLYDKSVHLGQDPDGTVHRPEKIGHGYHIIGKHLLVGKESFKDIFARSAPIIKAAGKLPVLLLTPLPSYIADKCCGDPGHVTNFGDPDYAEQLRAGMSTLCRQLRGLVHFRGWKNVHSFDTAGSIGISAGSGKAGCDSLEEAVTRAVELWGTDPVHPTGRAYAMIGNSALTRAKELVSRGKKRTAEAAESESGDSDVAVIGTFSGSGSDRATSGHYHARIRDGSVSESASRYGGEQSHARGSNARIREEHVREEGRAVHYASIRAHSTGPWQSNVASGGHRRGGGHTGRRGGGKRARGWGGGGGYF